MAAEFIAKPQGQEVVEGHKAEFVCSVSKDSFEVKWFRGDNEITADDKHEMRADGKKRVLIIKNCDMKDEGSYTVKIGTVRAKADLTVIGK